MSDIKLTIAIPSISSRLRMHLEPLYAKILAQVGDKKDVEVLSIVDNKTMSIGRKRTRLFGIASGRYTCIIDDDDGITDDYVETMRKVITNDLNVDVICYDQEANMNGTVWTVKTSLDHNQVHPFDQMQIDSSGKPIPCCRPPWHWCAWRTDFAKKIPFGDANSQEDTVFVIEAIKQAKSQLVLNKTLCKYKWSPSVSQAPFQAISPHDVPKVSI